MAYPAVNTNDINAPLLAASGQYGPLPTSGVGTGAAVAVANSLLLTNYYVTGAGGSKANSGINFQAQIAGDTP